MFKSLMGGLIVLALVAISPPESTAQKSVTQKQEARPALLLHQREGGTPYNPEQSFRPYSIQLQQGRASSDIVASPPEFDPVKGVLYKYASGVWDEIVTAMVAELTGDPSHDEIAYVVVTSAAQQNAAASDFAAAGADLSKVEFLIHPSESIWMRDYGPHFVWINGTLTIADSHYYPGRPLDNFLPTLIGDEDFGIPTVDQGLYYSGGNFQPGPNRSGFVTALIDLDNPSSQGFDASQIIDSYQNFQGIDTLHIVPQLPPSVDGTGHIDMWMYLIDEDTVILSEFVPGSNADAINATNSTVTYMESLGYEVFRPEAWNSGGSHYTYANAYRVNDRIFVPCYGTQLAPGGLTQYNDEDARAIAIWEEAAGPNIEIVPIQCNNIIWASGAIHCIVKQVPRYSSSTPATHVISPAGNDVLVSGSVSTIRWHATDTDNASVPDYELYYSTDGGSSWQFIDSVSNVYSYAWQVPEHLSSQAMIRVVATATDGDSVMDESGPFTINPGTKTTYDFASGAGTDKWIFGLGTNSWSNVDGNASPVSSQITSTNYSRLSTSNATGTDSDTNRYIAGYPGGSGETTHVLEFEISEDARNIDELVLRWEGYADRCTQVELYIWDFEAQQWGDGKGLLGQNRYMASYAGNKDDELVGVVRSNFCNFVDNTGMVRFLVYGERQGDESFHDYVSLTVKETEGSFASLDITKGEYAAGEITNLFASDDMDYSLYRDSLSVSSQVQVVIQDSGKCSDPASMTFTLEASVFARRSVMQKVEMYNYDTAVFEEVDARAATRFNDSTATITPTGDLSRFVQQGTGNVEARVTFEAEINRARYTAHIDSILWDIE